MQTDEAMRQEEPRCLLVGTGFVLPRTYLIWVQLSQLSVWGLFICKCEPVVGIFHLQPPGLFVFQPITMFLTAR